MCVWGGGRIETDLGFIVFRKQSSTEHVTLELIDSVVNALMRPVASTSLVITGVLAFVINICSVYVVLCCIYAK